MKLWKQIAAVGVIAVGMVTAWQQLSPFATPAGERPGWAERSGAAGAAARPGRGMGRGDRPASRVITAKVAEAEAGSRLVAIGTARAAQSVTLHSQTAGLVNEIAFAPGDRVTEGDVLIRLDDSEEHIAVEQARLELQAAEDTVGRYDRLEQSQSIPAVQAEEARIALARARNALAAAELALERRNVRAPFSGVMGFAEIDVGDMLANTTPLANIDDRDTLIVEFHVPERFAALIEHGTIVTATTAAHSETQFAGEIVATNSRIEPDSRTLKVRAALPNEDDRLRPGMAFSVTVDFDTPGHPAVPKVALQWDRHGAYVWKVVDDHVARTPVGVVARTATAVLVNGEIAPADLVVAEGADGLREGAAIADASAEPREQEDAAAPLALPGAEG